MVKTEPKTSGSTRAGHTNRVQVRADPSVLSTTRTASCVVCAQHVGLGSWKIHTSLRFPITFVAWCWPSWGHGELIRARSFEMCTLIQTRTHSCSSFTQHNGTLQLTRWTRNLADSRRLRFPITFVAWCWLRWRHGESIRAHSLGMCTLTWTSTHSCPSPTQHNNTLTESQPLIHSHNGRFERVYVYCI